MSLPCNSHNGPLSCSVPCYLKVRANGRNNSQDCWANNVGRCCVRIGDGVQTDATTPNNVGTCSASWEGYNPRDFFKHEFYLGACVALTMLEELCKRIQRCCATRRGSLTKGNVGSCSLKSLTGLKLCFALQHAKECENGRNM